MGGGASSIGVEELIQSTYIIGRAIAAITFPGMYRIYDFHSPKAPKLKSAKQFVFFDNDSDDDDEDDEIAPQDPSQYEHFFKVMVNDEAVYLEDVLYENEAGWTALHTCCMSFITAPAGQAIADEVARMGGSLNGKTRVGPGTFNRGWSALHMSCAYGVEPMVEKLLSLHADPNATNSYGYTPLLEACHRGFAGIVQLLVKGGVDIDYMPPEELSASSPFVAAPAHTALGEAARCGFQKIVQVRGSLSSGSSAVLLTAERKATISLDSHRPLSPSRVSSPVYLAVLPRYCSTQAPKRTPRMPWAGRRCTRRPSIIAPRW